MPISQARARRISCALFATGLTIAIAACGGSGNNPGPVVGVTPSTPVGSPTPPVIPSVAAFTTATSAPLPAVTAPPAGQTPAPLPIALPTTAAGFGGTFSLPIAGVNSIAANTTAVVTLSNSPPKGAPTTLALRRPQSLSPLDSASLVPMLFLEMFFSGGVSLANQPSVSFQVPANQIVSGVSYYVALYDYTRPGIGWQLGFEGPGVITGTSISFTGGPGSFNFTPFSPYVFALYAQSAAAATPTPAPTPTPTPPPTPTPSPTPPGATPTPIPTPAFGVTPASISLYAIGATATISASGTAPYFAISNNTAVATVSPPNGNSPFTVTAVAAGAAQITIVDSTGLQAIIPVIVTTTSIPVQGGTH